MPNQYCFLCASDEGVFLDITEDNGKSFGEFIETCLLVKITEKPPFSNKLCHKCAFELQQCDTFVKKYKQARQEKHPKGKRNCCVLCYESIRKECTFDITKDKNPLSNPFQKIYDIFNENVNRNTDSAVFMCLSCRYTLDILFDLKTLYRETVAKLEDIVERELSTVTFEKIKTTVVSRKTTATESNRVRLSTSSDSESDSSIMARSRKTTKLAVNKSKLKNRVCEQCNNSVKNGDDMYKLHKTSKTVCRGCWMSTDPNVRMGGKRTRQNSDTKLCTVFLKDILADSTVKQQKGYKTEKDTSGNTIYVISDESSESEKASPSTTKETNVGGRTKRKVAETKNNKVKKPVGRPSKKRKISRKVANQNESVKKDSKNTAQETASQSSSVDTITTRRGARLRSSQSSDSDISSVTFTKSGNMVNARMKRTASSASLENPKDNRKKIRTVLNVTVTSVKGSNSSEASNDETNEKKRAKQLSTSSDEQKEKQGKSSSGSESSKSSASKKAKASTSKSRNKPKRAKVTKNKSEEKIEDKEAEEEEQQEEEEEEEKISYTCTECGISYENKLVGLAHQLTHFKQAELKLCKVTVPEKSVDEDESNSAQTTDDIDITTKDAEDTNEDLEESKDQEIVDDAENEDSTKKSVTNEEEEPKKLDDAENNVDITETAKDSTDTTDIVEKVKEDEEEVEKTEKESDTELSQDKENDIDASPSTKSTKATRRSTSRSRSNSKERSVGKQIRRRTSRASRSSKESDSCAITLSTLDVVEEGNEPTATEQKTDDVDMTNNISDEESTAKDQVEIEELKDEEEVEEKEVESETDIKITNIGSSENSVEPEDITLKTDPIEINEKNDIVTVDQTKEKDSTTKDEDVDSTKDADTTEEINTDGTKDTDTDKTENINIDTVKDTDINTIKDTDTDTIKETDTNNTKDVDTNDTKDDIDLTKEIDMDSAKDDTESIKDSEKSISENIDATKEMENEREDSSVKDTESTKVNNMESIEITDVTEAKETANVTEITDLNNTEDTKVTEDDKSDLSKDTKLTKPNVLKTVGLDQENSNDSINTATELIKEVFDLAAAEVQNRRGSCERNSGENSVDTETLENITREIQNSADVSSLDVHDDKVKVL